MVKTIPVSVGIILNEDKVLIGKRSSGHYSGFWEFPGGKVEPGESSYEALCRELYEELGITVDEATEIMHLKKQHPHITVHLNIWLISKYSGEIVANEQQELQWAYITELKNITTIPTNLPIIEYLEDLKAE